jgi:hypothetical protein
MQSAAADALAQLTAAVPRQRKSARNPAARVTQPRVTSVLTAFARHTPVESVADRLANSRDHGCRERHTKGKRNPANDAAEEQVVVVVPPHLSLGGRVGMFAGAAD